MHTYAGVTRVIAEKVRGHTRLACDIARPPLHTPHPLLRTSNPYDIARPPVHAYPSSASDLQPLLTRRLPLAQANAFMPGLFEEAAFEDEE